MANIKSARKNLHIFVAINNHLAKGCSCGFFTVCIFELTHFLNTATLNEEIPLPTLI